MVSVPRACSQPGSPEHTGLGGRESDMAPQQSAPRGPQAVPSSRVSSQAAGNSVPPVVSWFLSVSFSALQRNCAGN